MRVLTLTHQLKQIFALTGTRDKGVIIVGPSKVVNLSECFLNFSNLWLLSTRVANPGPSFQNLGIAPDISQRSDIFFNPGVLSFKTGEWSRSN